MIRRILIIFAYLLAGLVIIGGTLSLVEYGQGYTYDFGHHRFVHRGLILFGSVPSGAYITRDSVFTKHTTNRRDSYNPGSYTFKVDKPGYFSWTKTLTVKPGQVIDARYIILPPKNLVTTTVATTSVFATSALSTDNRHLAYSSAATVSEGAVVWTLDLPGGKPTKRFNLTPATATDPTESILSLQWSGDASHLLVISQDASGRVYRVMNADGSSAVNLTTQYKLDFNGQQSLSFAPSDWHDMFWIAADGSLRRLDLNAQSVSNVLATGVGQFSYAADRLLYVDATPLGQSLMTLQVHNPAQINRLIQSLPKSPTYAMSYASYLGTDELVIIPTATREATVYSGIFGSSPVSTVIARAVDNVMFSPDGHFAALYSTTNLVTYDFDLSTPTSIVTYQSPVFGTKLTSLSWFGPYHLVFNLGGQSVFSDFDGTNRVVLASALDASVPFASSDIRSVYSFQASGALSQKLTNVAVR